MTASTVRWSTLKFAFVGWFITSYPRAAKALVIIAALGLLWGMYSSVLRK